MNLCSSLVITALKIMVDFKLNGLELTGKNFQAETVAKTLS